MSNVEEYFKQLQQKEQLIFDAENALNSAKHQYENVSKLLAIAVCPFTYDEVILLPYHRGKRWECKGRVVGIHPPRFSLFKGLYELNVVILKRNGADSKLFDFVVCSEELEKRNNKPLSPTYNTLNR
ncbi:hypothetical protein [Desulfovibrio falkowii]|uniref:Uncharacterized protein n=1 Tax=Desulfovibrio falkowii TaxID=3136602 RepID=A0ABQ0EA29_9BACT